MELTRSLIGGLKPGKKCAVLIGPEGGFSDGEVEAARKLADLKKLDAMRIFLKKLDTKVYNGDYEVTVRLYFPNEEAMKTETSQDLAYPILLFFQLSPAPELLHCELQLPQQQSSPDHF